MHTYNTSGQTRRRILSLPLFGGGSSRKPNASGHLELTELRTLVAAMVD